jgi:hypothetical protein
MDYMVSLHFIYIYLGVFWIMDHYTILHFELSYQDNPKKCFYDQVKFNFPVGWSNVTTLAKV